MCCGSSLYTGILSFPRKLESLLTPCTLKQSWYNNHRRVISGELNVGSCILSLAFPRSSPLSLSLSLWTLRFSHVVFSTLTFENSLKMHTDCVQWLMPVIPAIGGPSDEGESGTQPHFRKQKKAQNVKKCLRKCNLF